MGVPKFFRYISERYPCLSELAREQCIPDFDNLYLDMNGIIHNCSHPDDTNIHLHLSEEEMFKSIFSYIDKLFFLIKPQKLFFMAVDGVAPRAKMNQQRSRRFRSAKEAEVLENAALRRGEKRLHERFDSNCITPGTEFMHRLHEALKYFIKSKISADPLWQKCRVILSGQDCPGEGEHKIMNYIRYLKSKADYDANTRHCLYGLDADLIILGLCTHELHFVILREEVKFGRQAKRTSVEATRFFLLHLGLFREYLELEFHELRQADASFDIAKLIDDWVLMGYLVGNDFIPHLPCMHISSNALPLLYKTYIKVYPQLGGNINESGKLNLPRLEKFFAALAEVEYEIFQEKCADLKYFDAKTGGVSLQEAFNVDVREISNSNVEEDLANFIESSNQFLQLSDEDTEDEAENMAAEFQIYKRNYYINKLNQNDDDMSNAKKREQAIGYVTALQWILDYYYRGVQSWDWYYPHHYAPFISDLKNFSDHEIKLNMGKPFLPFQQLLAVLPAASKQLLPDAYQDLMTNSDSILKDFYPTDFQTDLNGKQHEWEAVVLIPFIDEQVLLTAMKACESKLLPSERQRNHHGPMIQYDYTPLPQGSAAGVYTFKRIENVFCTETPIWNSQIDIKTEHSLCVELPNASRTVFFPGFPTMKHLKYNFELKPARVRVFDYPSRNDNMILQPHNRPNLDDASKVAEQFLNQEIYIGWPHLTKAKVTAISSNKQYIRTDGINNKDPKAFELEVKSTQEHIMSRMGIEFADYSVLLHVQTYVGTTYAYNSKGSISVNDSWSSCNITYPAQGAISQITVNKQTNEKQYKKIEELFPVGSTIFFTGKPYYGSEGKILNPQLAYENGRLQVEISVPAEPELQRAHEIQEQMRQEYVVASQVASIVGLDGRSLGRLTGHVLVVPGQKREIQPESMSKLNIGLQLKFPKQNEARAGYTQRTNYQWYYTNKAVQLIKNYCEKFPAVIEYLCRTTERNEFCFEEDIFPDAVGKGGVEGILTWLKSQEHLNAERVSCGSKTAEKEAVQAVLEAVDITKGMAMKEVKLQVKPFLLIKPDVTLPSVYKSKRPIALFDRVTIVRLTYMVPIGSKGTVVGIHPVSDPNPVRLECSKKVDMFYDVLFDKPLPNGHDIHGIAIDRVCRVPELSLLLVFPLDNEHNASMYTQQKFQNTNNDRNNFKENAFATTNASKFGNNDDKRRNTTQSNAEMPSTSKATAAAAAQFFLPVTDVRAPQKSFANNNFEWNEKQRDNFESNKQQLRQKPYQHHNQQYQPQHHHHHQEQYQNQQQRQQARQPQQHEPQQQVEKPKAEKILFDTADCEQKTEVLKNLLGLPYNKTDPFKPQSNVQHQNVMQLPKPPINWRNDARTPNSMWRDNTAANANGRENSAATLRQRDDNAPTAAAFTWQRENNARFAYNRPHPHMHGSVPMTAAPHLIPTLSPPPSNYARRYNQSAVQYPQYPSYRNNENQYSSNRHFSNTRHTQAFIPLQAMRNNANINGYRNTSAASAANDSENRNDSSCVEAVNFNNTPRQYRRPNEQIASSSEPRNRTKKVPKIGARFDFAQ